MPDVNTTSSNCIDTVRAHTCTLGKLLHEGCGGNDKICGKFTMVLIASLTHYATYTCSMHRNNSHRHYLHSLAVGIIIMGKAAIL